MRASLFLVVPLALAAAVVVRPAHSKPHHDNRSRSVLCQSQSGNYTRCDKPWRGDAQLVQQLSDTRCVRGRTWGVRHDELWVNNGCRGRFAAVGYNGGGHRGFQPGPDWNRQIRVNCSSSGYNYQMCRVDVGREGRVQLRRQTSNTACVEGRTWGWNRAGVWVNQGCAGEFVIDRRW